MPSLAVSIPDKAVVLPPRVRFSHAGGQLIIQKISRRVRKFKTSKATRQKISAASKKFKVPLLTGLSLAPAVLLSVQDAMLHPTLLAKVLAFTRTMLSFYTGMFFGLDGKTFRFEPARLAIGWGPIVAVGTFKAIAKGRLMAINRALSRAQIPVSTG